MLKSNNRKIGIKIAFFLIVLLIVLLGGIYFIRALATQLIDSFSGVVNGVGSSIALDTNGFAHISSYVEDPSVGSRIRYCNNTAGTWSCANVTTVPAAGIALYYTSLAVDSNNKEHISFETSTGGGSPAMRIDYCNNTNGPWSCAIISSAFEASSWNSLALDSNNNAHIASADAGNNGLRYCNNTAGTWSCALAKSVGSVTGVSIAVDSNNKEHITYRDTFTFGSLAYCNNTNGAWSCAAINAKTNTYSSLAIDSNNNLHVAFDQGTLGYCNKTMTASSWNCSTADGTVSSGQYPSLAIDSNDIVHITHWSSLTNASGGLRYCNNTAGTWSCMVIVNTTSGIQVNTGRGLAITKGRIVDSTKFSNTIQGSYYNSTPVPFNPAIAGLAYFNQTIPLNDTCIYRPSYSLGNWYMNCDNNCIISTNQVVPNKALIKNLTISGSGIVTISAGNISNFSNYIINGGCTVKCINNSCIKA